MPHMMPVIEMGSWVECETDNGTEIIPVDVCGALPDYDHFERAFHQLDNAGLIVEGHDVDSAWLAACLPQVVDYLEGGNVTSIVERIGWGARLSAPGYLDCTEWALFESYLEAADYIRQTWDVCPNCGEELTDSDDCQHCAN